MKKEVECELCGSRAKMYCESDQASLCWECDSKVHGVNFLVAKHFRALLCPLCQAQTPWKATGPILAPSLSFCLSCLSHTHSSSPPNQQQHCNDNDDDDDDDVEDDDGDGDDDDGDDEDDEDDLDDDDDDDGENQVVPWTSIPQPSPNMVAASSETEDDNNAMPSSSSFKRTREIAFFQSSDNVRL